MPEQCPDWKKQEQENRLADYLDKGKQISAGDIKTNNTTSEPQLEAFSSLRHKTIFGHNFSLKFPLKPNCKIPFSSSFFGYTKLPRGVFNVRYDFHHPLGFVRQTNKSLIVFPFLEKAPALPLKSFELKARLSEKAVNIARDLMAQFPSLRLSIPEQRPSTQEYAIKDSYAQGIDFTFENEIAKIDKSPHVDESGFQGSGGEIDWKTPEFADKYIRMPFVLKKVVDDLAESLRLYDANIKLHLAVEQKQADNLVLQTRFLRSLLPKPERWSVSRKNSATLRGVS